ncbi:MAG: hypothetical protein J6A25_00755 [Lachnospiraceae bacterium]|nr:hypothetical protein [Lachnospiraceae bacterium]
MNLIRRKSITSSELSLFNQACSNIFFKKSNNTLKTLQGLFKDAVYNKSNNCLKLKSYANDILVKPNIYQASHVITSPEGFIGIRNIKCIVNELEKLTLNEPITPINLFSGILIQKTSDRSSGIDSVTLSNIKIIDQKSHTLVPEDLNGVYENGINNKKTISFESINGDNGYFGTKKFLLTVPIYNKTVLKLTPETDNCIFSPSDILPDYDGSNGKDAVIGIKSIKLDAARYSFTAADFIKIAKDINQTILKKASTEKDASGDTCICFDSISIPAAQTSCYTYNLTKEAFWTTPKSETTIIPYDINKYCCNRGELKISNLPQNKILTVDVSTSILAFTQALSNASNLKLNISTGSDEGKIILESGKSSQGVKETKLAHKFDYITGLELQMPKIKALGEYSYLDLISNSLPDDYPYKTTDTDFALSERSADITLAYTNNKDSNTYFLKNFQIKSPDSTTFTVALDAIESLITNRSSDASFVIRSRKSGMFIETTSTNFGVDLKHINVDKLISSGSDLFIPTLGNIEVTLPVQKEETINTLFIKSIITDDFISDLDKKYTSGENCFHADSNSSHHTGVAVCSSNANFGYYGEPSYIDGFSTINDYSIIKLPEIAEDAISGVCYNGCSSFNLEVYYSITYSQSSYFGNDPNEGWVALGLTSNSTPKIEITIEQFDDITVQTNSTSTTIFLDIIHPYNAYIYNSSSQLSTISSYYKSQGWSSHSCAESYITFLGAKSATVYCDTKITKNENGSISYDLVFNNDTNSINIDPAKPIKISYNLV